MEKRGGVGPYAGAGYNLTLSQSRLRSPVAEFIDPWLGDKVNSGIGLSGTPGFIAGGPVR